MNPILDLIDPITSISLDQINEDLRLSPGNATTMCARLRDKDVARKRDVCKTKKFKVSMFNNC